MATPSAPTGNENICLWSRPPRSACGQTFFIIRRVEPVCRDAAYRYLGQCRSGVFWLKGCSYKTGERGNRFHAALVRIGGRPGLCTGGADTMVVEDSHTALGLRLRCLFEYLYRGGRGNWTSFCRSGYSCILTVTGSGRANSAAAQTAGEHTIDRERSNARFVFRVVQSFPECLCVVR